MVLNTTMAMNIPARGLQMEAGSEIVMGDQEYASTRNIWEVTAKRKGLVIRLAKLPMMPTDSEEIVDAFAAAMTRNTKLVLFSHILYHLMLITYHLSLVTTHLPLICVW